MASKNLNPFRIYYVLQILDGFLLDKTNEGTDMDKYWSYEELEYEKYYAYFTPEEWQKFLTCKSQLDALHPQKIFEQKKRNLIRSYEDFLSPDITDKFLNSDIVRGVILDNRAVFEAKREKIKKDCNIDSLRSYLDKLSLNNKKKIHQLLEPAEHFERRGRFIIYMLTSLVLTIFFFIVFNLMGVTVQNATDTVYLFFKILIIIGCIIIVPGISIVILSDIDFFSNDAKYFAISIAVLISIASIVGCIYLCVKYFNPTQGDYHAFGIFFTIILFGTSLVISKVSSASFYIVNYIYKNSSSFKTDTDSRYREFLMKDENMEILAVSFWLDDILYHMTTVWIKDNHLHTLESNYLKMKQLFDMVKERADSKNSIF